MSHSPSSGAWLPRALRLFFFATALALTGGAVSLKLEPARVALAATCAGSAVTGTVFRDYNANGTREASEPGIAGIVVTAYASNGTATTCETGATGTYGIDPVPAFPLRLEFTLPADGHLNFLQPGAAGPDSATTVTFVNAPTAGVDVGFSNPADFCGANPAPDLVTSCHVFGEQNNNPDGVNKDAAVLREFPYTAGSPDLTNAADVSSPPPTQLAVAQQTGAIWGLAWNPQTQTIYAAAFMRRHTGFGPSGPGAIYQLNAGVPSLFYNFGAIAGTDPHPLPGQTCLSPGHNPNNTNFNCWLNDSNSFDLVGKVGFGDLEIAEDFKTLYTINLANNTLMAIPVDNPAGFTATPVPTPTSCPATDTRPFAVAVHDGIVYVGMVCSAESTADRNNLRAYIYTFAGGAFNSTPVLEFPLTYNRNSANLQWQYWLNRTTFNPANAIQRDGKWAQPWLTSITFENGNMILGFRDRNGDLFGTVAGGPDPADPNNYSAIARGDILRACGNAAGGWTLEANGTCGGITTAGAGNGQGPGGGEYYFQDQQVNPTHQETSYGAQVHVPGLPDIVSTVFNPIEGQGAVSDAGIKWYNNATGTTSRGYMIFDASGDPARFEKANGLGDVEALCPLAPTEIGNRVWNDANRNGVQDAGEAPLAGVTVQLFKTGQLVATAITNALGEYYFVGGGPDANPNDHIGQVTGGIVNNQADYEIRITLNQAALASFLLTTPNGDATANGDLRDSDFSLAGANAVFAIPTTGNAGANNHTYDAGFYQTSYDRGDLPDSGAGVGATNYETLLANNGPSHAIVPGLLMGALIDAEADGQPSINADGDDVNPPAADDEDGVTIADLTLLAGTAASVRVNATNNTATGATLYGFIDFNADGDFADPGETATTGVPAGSNNALVTLNFGVVPAGSVTSSYARFRLSTDPAAAQSGGIATDGEVEDYPVSIAQPLNLGNLVWQDANNNGLVDAGENGIDGVSVQLFRAGQTPGVDAPVATVTTSGGGIYNFPNLTPGDYFVYIPTPPTQFPISSTNTDLNDNGEDNDDNGQQSGGAGTAVRSPLINLAAGAEPVTDGDGANGDLTIDFGFFAPVRVGDRVWFDSNSNGLQDAGEPGVPNIAVTLFNADGTAARDINGATVPAQNTNANGLYLFANLPPGSYYVVFDRETLPINYTVTTPNTGDDAADSDANPGTGQTAATPSIASGGEDLTLDMGIVLRNDVRVGDYVWLDSNRNGRQDAGEAGVPNVTVRIFNAANNQELGVDVTDNSGFYLFDNLPPGLYYVVFDLTTLPAGSNITAQNAAGVPDDQDSDANPTTGRSNNSSVLNAGQEDLTLDMGIYLPVSLGNLVWVDSNDNGLVDVNESGVAGLPVRLFTPSGTLVATTTTDINGNYRFINLVPGDYYVEVEVDSNLGYYSSTGSGRTSPNSGPYEPAADPDNDIDNDDNGTTTVPTTTIRSGPVTLTVGGEPVGGGNSDASYNPTVDFGLVPVLPTALAALGDRVWLDQACDGVQAPNDSGVANVTVNLFKADGSLAATMQTDANGNYRFDNLEPGIYFVEFIEPTGYTFTLPKQGANIAADSDPDTTTGRTPAINLAPDETDLTWDAGLCAPPTGLDPDDEPDQVQTRLFLPLIKQR